MLPGTPLAGMPPAAAESGDPTLAEYRSAGSRSAEAPRTADDPGGGPGARSAASMVAVPGTAGLGPGPPASIPGGEPDRLGQGGPGVDYVGLAGRRGQT